MKHEEAEKIIQTLILGEEYIAEDDIKGEMLVFGFNSFIKKFYIRRTDTIAGSYVIVEEYDSFQSIISLLNKI